MTKKEKNKIINWAQSLSNEELESEYYKAVYESLGTQTEEMYERGYDIQDIIERERFETYLDQRADIIGSICEKRGIKLWEKEKND